MIQTESSTIGLPKLLSRPRLPRKTRAMVFSLISAMFQLFLRPLPGRAARRIVSPENRGRGEKICNEVKREPISPCFPRAPSTTHNFRLTHSRSRASRLVFWDERFSPLPHESSFASMALLRRKLRYPARWCCPFRLRPHKQKDFPAI